MRITDELREWASVEVPYNYSHKPLAIADHIDDRINDKCERMKCEYEREFEEWKHTQDTCYVKLPVDADGVPIRIGDILEADGNTFEVWRIELDESGEWTVRDRTGVGHLYAHLYRHRYEPTVEEVLREMAVDWDCAADGMDKEAVLKEYASKLRLASDKQ